MSELRLISSGRKSLKPLVEAALQNELRVLEAGIRQTEQKLSQFEKQFNLSTTEFIKRYESNRLDESLEFAEWIGEHRLLKKLQEKANILREIRFAN